MEHPESKNFPILTTERLILRQLTEFDAPEIFRLRSDAEINKYLGRPPCKTLEEASAFIQKIKENSLSYWAITSKGNEKLMGTICLYDISEETQKCEIGYELLTEYQGKGLMSEAAKKVIEYANQILNIKTIDAYTHSNNQNSSRLLNALKFKIVENAVEVSSDFLLFRLRMDVGS